MYFVEEFHNFIFSVKAEVKLPNRNADVEPIPSKSVSPVSLSVSCNESETPCKTSNLSEKLRNRLLRSRTDMTTIVEPCEIPQNDKLVTISSVISHNIVFLRSIEKKDNERYKKYLNDVVENAKIAQPLDEMPKKGDIVLAEFEGAYYRALVTRILCDEVVVAFLEFGNLETKSISELKELRDDLKYVQRFTFKATLRDVNEGLKTGKCVNYLRLLVKSSIHLKFTRKEYIVATSLRDVQCELFAIARNESVNEKINELNNIKASTDDQLVYEYVIFPFFC